MQKPTLFGYGLTTKAIANSLGGGCHFYDDNCTQSYQDEQGNTIHPSNSFDPNKSELEVTTPSLPPSHPLIKKAKHLLSEYDYFLKENKRPFSIWISGTNGKTTTTQMLSHLLSQKSIQTGGNIGTPLAELDKDADIWILETSSFTLHHTHIASPDIYILLPITPDHINWHGSIEEYTNDKLKPLLTMKEGQLALIPKGLKLPQSDAFVVEYESNEALAEYFEIEIEKVDFKGAFLQDALLCMGVVKALFNTTDYDKINRFKPDAHRQERLMDAQGRVWINDSKATNLDATLQALKAYGDAPLHLILGGDDKGADMEPLFKTMQRLELSLYTIGSNSQRLTELAEKYHIYVSKCDTLKEAVHQIDMRHTQKSIAMLSPAAASLDQFSSYIERGDSFKNYLLALN